MTDTWLLAALWLGLALVASLVSIWLRIATALSEIVVGAIAQLLIGAFVGGVALGAGGSWIRFLAGTGAIVLTFLAGAELDPHVLRRKWKESMAIGLVSFAVPFFGCAAIAYWGLGWSVSASWLAGIAMSTTSVAVVYAVMLEFGFNATDYGKIVLAACFVTDLATVWALGFIFAPFTFRTVIFFAACVIVFAALPWLTPRFFKRYGNRPSQLEAKFLLFWLFALGGLAAWSETEAVIENSKQHYHKIPRPLHAVAKSETTVAIHFEVAVGHPAEQIVRRAEDWKADLVVVGHRGRTFFERWLIGSVAKHVINHAPCAVLVAR